MRASTGHYLRPTILLLLIAGTAASGCTEAELPLPTWDLSGEMYASDIPGEASVGDMSMTDVSAMPLCKESEACDDQDPCTFNDLCLDGECRGDLYDCEDDYACTFDDCLGDGECDNSLRPGWCFIAAECFEESDVNPAMPCLECITSVSQDEWSADNGNPCDDGDLCTVGDVCKAGACWGASLACPPATVCASYACENGECVMTPLQGDCYVDACTDSFCDNGECIGGGGLVDCGDENPCTDDFCDPATGCVNAPNNELCDDGNPCTLGDGCGGGWCVPGFDQPDCDDGNPCTDDSCHPVNGCVHFPNASPCDDGDLCQSDDFCIAGDCLPGPIPLICDDGNVCTEDACVPSAGCVYSPNDKPCDDGDICFADDFCQMGLCLPGPTILECIDESVCTADTCEPFVGCSFPNVQGPCNDESACTSGDACLEGECVGEPIVCEDGNACTADACDPDAGCTHKALKTPACRPKIVIEYPPRGVTLDGNPNIDVTGTVTSNGGPITSFTIGGADVSINEDGTFAAAFPATQGMNLIIAEVEDSIGGTARTTPSFYFSYIYYPVDHADPELSMVSDGIMAFLGPEVWDDDDTSDVDDMATIMTLFLGNLDLGSLITNPVTTATQLWCNYKVYVYNIGYGASSIDLMPVLGGLHMVVTIPDFGADVELEASEFACPKMTGKATASSITIDAGVDIWMEDGELKAEMKDSTVTVHDLNIQLEGIWGFLLNWLIDFFEEQFAAQLEEQFQEQLGEMIPNTIVGALNSMALDQDIEVKPFLGEGSPITLAMKTGLSSVDFTPEGGTLGLKATVTTPKLIAHEPLGSIGRASCLAALPESFSFPKLRQLELAVHDDFLNQMTFDMYWGGLFDMAVDPAELGVDLAQFGIEEIDLTVDALLPGILTSCTPDGALVLQLGDMRVDGAMNLYGTPVTMTMYASMEVLAEIIAVESPTGKQLSIFLGEVRTVEVEVAEVTGPLAGAEDVLVALVEENLVGGLLDSLAGGALGSFPIPDVDLSGFDPSIPPGTAISLDLQELLRMVGYTVLSGDVK